MKIRGLLAFAAILLNATDCFANLRPPKIIHHPPSSTLYRLSADPIVVREEMNVECDQHICDVVAKYIIDVENRFSAEVDFMIPGEIDVSVKVGQNSAPVRKKSVPYGKDPREKDAGKDPFFGIFNPLFRASFPLSLEQGQHEILIQYRQPLSQKEFGYGYFSEGYFVGTFQYELWPIKEWKIAPDFALNLFVALKSNSLSWWEQLVDDISVRCSVTTFTPCKNTGGSTSEICRTVENLHASEDLGLLVVKTQMHIPLPDRLSCDIGLEQEP